MGTLKEQLFNEETLKLLFDSVNRFYPIDVENIIEKLISEFKNLELKERISATEQILDKTLDLSYLEVLEIFDSVMAIQKGEHFVFASVLEYVEKKGVDCNFVHESLKRLGEYTNVFSAEFAIRPFLNNHEKETIDFVKEWSVSSNLHKRRLASEGTRPSLPWAMNVNLDYRKSIEWLDNLYYDKERYVTRSVANHLNDISKIDPGLVVRTLKRWRKSRKQSDTEMTYIINHSLRTLVKRGNELALEFLGYNLNPVLIVDKFSFDKSVVTVGESANLQITIHSKELLLVDYVVHFITKSGRPSRKVYKLSKLQGDQVYNLERKVAFHNRSTRKIYPGVHKVELQVNGKVVAEVNIKVKGE